MRILLMTMVVVLAGAMPSSQSTQAVPDFSGLWSLDLAKSKYPGLPAPPQSTLKVIHKEPEITTTRIQEGIEDTVRFRTDGKEMTSTTACCGDVVASAKWNGSSLMRVLRGTGFIQRDTWSLGASGQELTMARRIESESGDQVTEITLVYRKDK